MTRRAVVRKWILYCLCALLLVLVQNMVLVYVRIGGVHPFAAGAGADPRHAGAQRAVAAVRPVFGLACDLLMPTGVFVCFYCLVFFGSAFLARLLSGQVIVAGLFCSLAVSAVGLLLCGFLRILLLTYQQGISTGPALTLLGKELLLSLAVTPLAHFPSARSSG